MEGPPAERKVRARLRYAGVRTSPRRVLRVMRAHDLLAHQRAGSPRGPRTHDFTITTLRVDEMWDEPLSRHWSQNDRQLTPARAEAALDPGLASITIRTKRTFGIAANQVPRTGPRVRPPVDPCAAGGIPHACGGTGPDHVVAGHAPAEAGRRFEVRKLPAICPFRARFSPKSRHGRGVSRCLRSLCGSGTER